MPPIRPDAPPPSAPDHPRPSPLVLWARRFPATRWGVRGARSFATNAVESALRGAPVPRSFDDVELLAGDVGRATSELASSAVRLGADRFEVVLDIEGDQVQVEVRDSSASVTVGRRQVLPRGNGG